MNKLLLLDMWAEQAVSSGPSKKWLHQCLGQSYEVHTVNADNLKFERLIALCKTFSLQRKIWGPRYYSELEHLNKRPEVFKKRTILFKTALSNLAFQPQAILQIGGLFGPVNLPGIPYYTYHDQTVRMVERDWPDWLPTDFSSFRDKWYALETKLYQSVTKIITYSEKAKKSMINDYAIKPDKVIVIPTACKMEPASDVEMALPKSKQILFVSTEFYRKGGELVLKAARIIKEYHPDANILILGGKVPGHVVFDPSTARYVGCLSQDDLRQLYLQSSLILHPARYDAFPNVLKEALACCLPAVASNSGGIAEIVLDGQTGVLLSEVTPKVIAESVIYLLDNPAVLSQMRACCKEYRKRFAPANVCRQFHDTIGTL